MIIRIDIGQDKINDVIYKGLNFVIATLPPEVLLNMRNDEQRGERAAFLPPQLFVIWGHTKKMPTHESKSAFPPDTSSASILFSKPTFDHRCVIFPV